MTIRFFTRRERKSLPRCCQLESGVLAFPNIFKWIAAAALSDALIARSRDSRVLNPDNLERTLKILLQKRIALRFVNTKVNGNSNEFVMKHVISPGFQVITTLPDPLGLFFRAGRADHTTIDQLVSEGRTGLSGAVLDRTNVEFQHDLATNLAERKLGTVLDPLALELSTRGGVIPRRAAT